MSQLTIFWTALAKSDVEALEAAVREQDAALAQVAIESLPSRATPALATGAVVAVCRSNNEASQALCAGVDEVVRSGEITHEALQAAIDRAFARASARFSRRVHRTAIGDEQEHAFALLEAAMCEGLAKPLDRATDECARLSQALPGVLDASDDLVAWTSRSPHDTPRRIAVRRLAAPSSGELRDTILRLHESLRNARAAIRAILSLAGGDDAGETSASSVTRQVVDALSMSVPDIAIGIEADGPGVCTVPRRALVLVLCDLFAHSLSAIRASETATEGVIIVRVYTVEESVIIEVQDNGVEISADLRPDASDPFFRDKAVRRGGLPGVRDRVRRLGGDLIVDSGSEGSIVRVMMPVAASEEHFEDVRDAPRDERY